MDDLEFRQSKSEDNLYEYHYASGKETIAPWKAKLMVWAMVTGGIALGTVLFLFFITVFVYVLLPILMILSLVFAYRSWKYRNMFR